MFLDKIVVVALVGGFGILGAACSNDVTGDTTTKTQGRAEAACEHINGVCAKTQGFQTRDCAATEAEYEKLEAAEKGQADGVISCIMAATSCQSSLGCTNPSQPTASANEKGSTPAQNPEEACEHINDLCASEAGFKHQDCSHSNADYAKLDAKSKQIADQIAPCIMEAQSCKAAFQCLQLN